MNTYTSICLSGGGMQGFQILGALKYIEEHNINNLSEFVGTSAGAMICYLLAIGYTIVELLTKLNSTKVFDRLKYMNVMQMIQEGGATTFTPLQEFLEKLTIEKIGKFLTLEALKNEYNKEFKCVTYNFTKKTHELLSAETTPDLPCITAVRLSSTIPFIFPPYKYDNCEYLDGGLTHNFPISFVSEPAKCIAICVTGKQAEDTENKVFDPVAYAIDILNISIDHQMKEHINLAREKDIKILIIEKTSGVSFKFDLDMTSKLNLFSNGYNIAKKSLL